jgi:hypothetical protein
MRAPKAMISEYTRPVNDYVDDWLSYEEEGRWHEEVLRDVPLSSIDVPEVWNPGRFADNLTKLKRDRAMPPVRLVEAGNRHDVQDGIHRINAIMKYNEELPPGERFDAVPAIVTEARTDPPPDVPRGDLEKRRSVEMGYSLFMSLKRKVAGPIDWGEVKEAEAGPGAFVLRMERHDDDRSYSWTVEAKHGRRDGETRLDAMVTGDSHGRVGGDLAQTSASIARIIDRDTGVRMDKEQMASWVMRNCKFARLCRESDDVFDYGYLARDRWHDIVREYMEPAGISFDLENDDAIADGFKLTVAGARFACEPRAGCGDWQAPVLYYRCQLLKRPSGVEVKPHGIEVSPYDDSFFAFFPGPDEGNVNLVEGKKKLVPTDGNAEYEEVDERKGRKALRAFLESCLEEIQ